MKKLLAIILAAVLMMTMSLSAFAVPANLTGFISDPDPAEGLNLAVPVIKNLDVPVDMKVDLGMTGEYVDGPVSKNISDDSALANFEATLYMEDVRTLFNTLYQSGMLYFSDAESAHLKTRLENCLVTGSFEIKITYPENAVVPEAVLTGTALDGFDTSAAATFEETAPRTVAAGAEGTKELTITLDVKDDITAKTMYDSLETYLPDITFTASEVELFEGENVVVGTITGQTDIYDVNEDPTPDDLICTINYTGKQGAEDGVTGDEISETVTLTKKSGAITIVPPSPPLGGGDAAPGEDKDATVTVVVGGTNEDIELTTENGKVNIDELLEQVKGTREGFVAKGIYDSETGGNKLEGEVSISKDTTMHVQWVNVTVPAQLNGEDHSKYINGYPDGSVRPEANITREEIATIFFRLLKDEVREEIIRNENKFSDVEEGKWSNEAISTIANGGYINGYEDGTFRPEANITRAELATIVARFLAEPVEGSKDFSDIGGHWAEEYIVSAANNEWIYGDGNGTFRPDDYITRAEAITIINRILVRYVNEHGLDGSEIQWPDNTEEAWYYYAVIEASNAHDHTRADNGYHEIWNSAE